MPPFLSTYIGSNSHDDDIFSPFAITDILQLIEQKHHGWTLYIRKSSMKWENAFFIERMRHSMSFSDFSVSWTLTLRSFCPKIDHTVLHRFLIHLRCVMCALLAGCCCTIIYNLNIYSCKTSHFFTHSYVFRRNSIS